MGGGDPGNIAQPRATAPHCAGCTSTAERPPLDRHHGVPVKTLGQVGEYWRRDPQRTLELQTSIGRPYRDLWASAMRRMTGEPAQPVAEADPRDRRFADPEWSSNQFFDFLKQAYLLTTNWAHHMVEDAEGLDPHTRQKAEFYVRQIANAISPSNFVLTNPELLRETLSSNAENLVRGMRMLRSEEHTSELQSHLNLVCRLLLEKKKHILYIN